MIEGIARWLDDRLGGSSFVRKKMNYVFPESWTFLFGEVALYSFVVLVVTGTFIALFYTPSEHEVVYRGSYDPLQGVEMSAAYESVIRLTFDVRAGLLFRQIHHWAAIVFVAAIVVHLCRVFFTGAFRKPRELNWMIGVTMLILAIFEGFAGYSLPDDLLSGLGLRIGYSIAESIPVVGEWLAAFLYGGTFPGDAILERLFFIHVFIVPFLFFGLIGAHLAIIVRQHHTQFRGPGRTERNVVGVRAWPTYSAKSTGLLLLSFAVLAAMGGLLQINPIWLYGPFHVEKASTFAQPDWYMGWLEGSLRLFPAWEFRGWGVMIPNPFFPAVLLPGLTFLGLYLYPFVERWATRDHAEHHLLERPRERPGRTAFGAAALMFYFVLFVAGSQDILAHELNLPITNVVWFLRVSTIVAPVIVFFVVRSWMRALHAAGRPEGPEEYDEEVREAIGEPREHRERPRRRRGARLGLAAAGLAIGRSLFRRDRHSL